MVMTTQIAMTMTRRLMTKRIQRSNTLVAYKFVLALPGTVGVEQSHVLRARSLYRAVGSSTTFPLPHGSGTSCKSLDARKRHAPLGRRNWLGGIPKAVIPSPLAHAIGAGVWVATVASVALLANAATYFYLEYRLWNAWTRASLRHESQLSTSFDGDEKALRITEEYSTSVKSGSAL